MPAFYLPTTVPERHTGLVQGRSYPSLRKTALSSGHPPVIMLNIGLLGCKSPHTTPPLSESAFQPDAFSLVTNSLTRRG